MDAFALTPEILGLQDAAARFGHERLAPSVRDHERVRSWPPDVVDVVHDFSSGADPLAKVVLLETLAMYDAGGLFAADIDGPAAATGGPGWLFVPPAGAPRRVEWAPGWPAIARVWVSDGGGDELSLIDTSAASTTEVDALAFHASGGIAIDLDGCPVLEERTLPVGGGAAVRGWARLWCAAVAVGVAQSAFDATVAYTTERMVFGKPVAYHQGNAFALAGLATDIHGARLAVRDAATADDGGFSATQAFLTAVDTAVAVTDAGIQLLGGHGFLVDHLAEKRFREARMLGLLFGGRDSAEADAAALVLDVPTSL